MTRLDAIRTRLKDELVEQNYCSCIGQADGAVDYCPAHAHAPADLALLLAVAEAAQVLLNAERSPVSGKPALSYGTFKQLELSLAPLFEESTS